MLRQLPRRCMSTTFGTQRKPKPKLELDPSFESLMKDINASMSKEGNAYAQQVHPELEVAERYDVEDGDDMIVEEKQRKSPAAAFGSKAIGAVVLPLELSDAINRLITQSDKHRLREDAKRLFQDSESRSEGSWGTNPDFKYKSYEQRLRHSERDGTAFASIALPSHYSAILSVLQHTKHRLGSWQVDRVVDWGAATGSALWATLHAFQKETDTPLEDVKAVDSTVTTYLGIDKRDGLVDIGKRILRDIPIPPLADVSFRRGIPQPNLDQVPNTLAISAFSLSSQPSDLYRRRIIREMWASGAETMIIIDHANKDGFAAILDSRHTLLAMARSEPEVIEDTSLYPTEASTIPCEPTDVHIVAPCPHEHECPLVGSKLHCSFTQRLQRPDFVRRTKHSGVGHEDIEYSYVVIRRGPRPSRVSIHSTVGRHGRVSQQEAEKAASKATREVAVNEGVGHLEPSEVAESAHVVPSNETELEDALRHESYSWPRLIFPPLKKGGHIILDSCTPEGKISRLTVPRSQGKQEFYDARKSSWGDVFPHPPKNAPQDRYQPKRARSDGPVLRGADIGKRKGRLDDAKSKDEKSKKIAYEGLRQDIKAQRRKDRLARAAVLAAEMS